MCGIQVMRPKNRQRIGALGAALMADIGIDLIRDFDVAAEITKTSDCAIPNA